jgi:actin-like ATPase involved in cell morphogenesis
MSRKKVTVDFDSERIEFVRDGKLVLRVPSAVIRKKSETPVLIRYGDEAEKNKDCLADNEMYSDPFLYGKITDSIGARLLFRACLKKLFGRNLFIDVYVIIQGGATDSDKFLIEKTVIDAGYRNVYLIPRPKVIARLLSYNSLNACLYADNDITEFVLYEKGNIVSSYAMNVSYSSLAEVLRDRFLNDAKIKLFVKTSLDIVKNYCSLFPSDSTKIIAEGSDTITSAAKSVYISAKDLFITTAETYDKLTELISAALMDADKSFAAEILKTGILFIGCGVHMCGLEEFVYDRLRLGCIIGNNDSVIPILTGTLVSNDKSWTEQNAE